MMDCVNLENLALAEFGHTLHLLTDAQANRELTNSSALESMAQHFSIMLIKTCQRTLLIGQSHLIQQALHLIQPHAKPKFYFEDADAYAHLLRFSCGLESQVKGETDVFGQVKNALQGYLDSPLTNITSKNFIQNIFLKIFEDTKEIRAVYLQGIGGNSYGALARRLLDLHIPHSTFKNILVLGAGQISKRVVPYFAPSQKESATTSSLKVWNRTPARIHELNQLLHQGTRVFYQTYSQESDLPSLLKDADLILVALPAKSKADLFLAQLKTKSQVVLHLGAQNDELSHHCERTHFYSLNDLFELEKEQSDLRDRQVQQAITACTHRATLRKLSRTIVPHGWEDLALFN